MLPTYTRLLKKLHKKYPEKHICISVTHDYYDHTDRCKTEYYIYVADEVSKHIRRLPEVEKYVQYLCKKED